MKITKSKENKPNPSDDVTQSKRCAHVLLEYLQNTLELQNLVRCPYLNELFPQKEEQCNSFYGCFTRLVQAYTAADFWMDDRKEWIEVDFLTRQVGDGIRLSCSQVGDR